MKKPIETIHAHLNAMGTQRTTSLASEPQATPKRAIISVSGDSVRLSSFPSLSKQTIQVPQRGQTVHMRQLYTSAGRHLAMSMIL